MLKSLRFITISAVAVTIALTAACSKRLDTPDLATPLSVSASRTEFASADTSGGATKATEVKFQSGDAIGLYIHSTAEVGASANHSSNLKYITQDEGGTWSAASPIMSGFNTGTIYYASAYYPYKGAADAANPQLVLHTVAADQSGAAGEKAGELEQSDFMYCPASALNVANPNNARAALNFKHALTKLVIAVSIPVSIEDIDIDTISSVTIKSLKRKCNVNIANGAVSSLTDVGDITPRLTSGVADPGSVAIWEAIVVPQTVASGVKMVEISFKMASGDNKSLSYIVPAATPLTFAADKKITVALSSNADLAFTSTLDLTDGGARNAQPLKIRVGAGKAFTLTSDKAWITLATTATGAYSGTVSGTGTGADQTIYVNVAANDAAPYTPREATLLLADTHSVGNKGSMKYRLLQNFTKFNPSTAALTFNSAGQQYIAVDGFESNKVWTVSVTNTSGMGWVKLATSATIGQGVLSAPYEGVGALGKDKLFIQIASANEGAAARSEKIQYKVGEQVIKEFTVTQMPIPATVTVAGVEWTTANLAGQAGQAISAGVALDPSAYGSFWKWGDKWVYGRASSSTDGDWTTYTSGASTAPAASLTSGFGYDYYFGLSGGRASGDPCKLLGSKYVTPTRAQLTALVASGKSAWTKYKDVNGYVFGAGAASYVANTTIPNGCVFFPEVGRRMWSDGSLKDEVGSAWYWSASVGTSPSNAWQLFINSTSVLTGNNGARGHGFSVRCVVETPKPAATVQIGDTEWCTTNLTAQVDQGNTATLAPYPQDAGVFYKWGDTWAYARASSATDGTWTTETSGASTAPVASLTSGAGYDYGYGLSGGRASGDPCLKLGSDYRAPTRAQWVALNTLGSKWGVYQGVSGRFFGPSANTESCNNTSIAANCIFLPAAGFRSWGGGALGSEGGYGDYWSSSVNSSTRGYYCYFNSGGIYPDNDNDRGYGFSVRCVKRVTPKPPVTVAIAGTKWATANLTGSAQGQTTDFTVATAPQDYGMFWKWGSTFMYNRTTGNIPVGHWVANTTMAATQPTVQSKGYDYANASGVATAGDPCKSLGENYRTPTNTQIKALYDSGYGAKTYKGVNGWFFGPSASTCNNTTIQPGCIFIPSAGCREYTNGTLYHENSFGYYWSSSANSATYGWILHFEGNDIINPEHAGSRGYGISVRCVENTPPPITTVEIAETKWTTANLTGDEQGQTSGFTVCASPSDYGMFWKWGSLFMYNRATGAIPSGHWGSTEADYNRGAATYPIAQSRDYDYAKGLSSSWGATAGDPCKKLGANYRTPTQAQIAALVASGKSDWTTYQGVAGYFFGPNVASCTNTSIASNCIFMPAAGRRDCSGGTLYNVGINAWYWSSSVYNATYGWGLYFDSGGNIYPENFNWRGFGFSVRCVQE